LSDDEAAALLDPGPPRDLAEDRVVDAQPDANKTMDKRAEQPKTYGSLLATERG
jgi:hypothetical protein